MPEPSASAVQLIPSEPICEEASSPRLNLVHQGRCLVQTAYTQAPADRVWSAWTEPDKIEGWFVERAERDGELIPGNTITWHYDSLGFSSPMAILAAENTAETKRLVVEPPRFERPPQPIETIIRDLGDRTELRIVHSGFGTEADGDEEFEGVRSDWYIELRMLDHYLTHYYGQPRTSAMILRAIDIEYPALMNLYRQESGLAQWLTQSGSISAEGEAYEFTLLDGEILSGKVIAITERDIAITCDQFGGVLCMKGLTFPAIGRMIALHIHAWEATDEQMAKLVQMLHEAADRLVEAAR